MRYLGYVYAVSLSQGFRNVRNSPGRVEQDQSHAKRHRVPVSLVRVITIKSNIHSFIFGRY